MTREAFERAREINGEIKKYEESIDKIKTSILVKKNKDKEAEKSIRDHKRLNPHSERWTLSKFFLLRFEGRKIKIFPHYEFAQAIEIDADAELVDAIIDHLEKRKKMYETEFEMIETKLTNQ